MNVLPRGEQCCAEKYNGKKIREDVREDSRHGSGSPPGEVLPPMGHFPVSGNTIRVTSVRVLLASGE